MNIYLLRHGEAGSHVATGDDSRRPLTPDGMEKMRRQAETLVRWQIKVDTILSSPFVRARQTAEIVADALKLTVIDEELLAAGQFNRSALENILSRYKNTKHLLLAGHEPDFSMTLAQVIDGGNFDFKKGALARVKLAAVKPAEGDLVWFLTPELMGAGG
jgi:phosphohistidine phosphatase